MKEPYVSVHYLKRYAKFPHIGLETEKECDREREEGENYVYVCACGYENAYSNDIGIM